VVPVVGWAERGGYGAIGHGNSVPRFHVTWGTGPGVVAPFAWRVREAVARGQVELRFRHRVDHLDAAGDHVTGVSGAVLEPSDAARGAQTSRVEVGGFARHAQAVVLTSGGIGGNHDLVRANWPERLGTPPAHMLSVSPRTSTGGC
jgi:predicted oxidoreductase